jgi:succinate-semialdehyde dehydrogenase/glutarate-semialdehyde dehydrogenase
VTTLGQLPAAEAEAIASTPRGLLIDGEWRAAASGGTFTVDDPSTASPLCDIADGGAADGVAALDAAVRAQPTWAVSAPRDRAAILRRAYEELIAARERLALVLTLEMGKPLAESDDEISYAAEYLLWFAEEAMRIDGRYAVAPDARGRVLVMQQPVGPCLIITPWNFPLVMATRAVAPAVAAGCTMVVKPSKLAPLTTLALADILQEAGLPPGVLNVVPGSSSRAITEPVIADDRLRKVTFTGSAEVGRTLIAQSSSNVLRLSMELGGNAPFIVFEDADVDAAVAGAVGAKMRNIGEACTSANRFYIARPVAEEFTRRLAERMSVLRAGRGSEPGTELGPLIDAASCDRLEELVADALDRGATLVTGGGRIDRPGHYFAPTVLANVPDGARVLREEIFGPVAPIRAFDDEEEVVALANGTEFGLAGYVYTSVFDRAIRVAEALETGMVGLNQGRVSNPMAPFGGVKQSGLGRAGGPEAITEYLETKYVAIHHRGA